MTSFLSELNNYYEAHADDQEDGVPIFPKYGYATRKVSFKLSINKGKFASFDEVELSPSLPDLVALDKVPTSGICATPFFGTDKYVLGCSVAEKVFKPYTDLKKLKGFIEYHEEILKQTRNQDLADALSFLRDILVQKANLSPIKKVYEATKKTGAIVLCVNGRMLHEQKSLIAYWEKVIADHKPLYGICSVTGKQTALRKLHSKIKIGGASAGGGSLISYNKSAHDSYLSGEKTVAAVGQRAEFGYRTAINYLLGTKNNCARIGDDYLIFWTKKRRSNWICRLFKNFFEEEKEDTLPTNIKSAIEALKQGKVPDNFPEKEKFCLAILAPNSGRVFVKNFSDQPLTDMFQAVAQHCKDTALEGYPVPTIPALAWASVSNKGDGAPHGSLYKSLLEAILTGEQYPMSAVLPALALCHKPGTVPRNRLALVKGYVNRHYRSTNYKEVPMGLDRERANIGYLLGRMLAVADAIHETSVGNPNRSLSDRFRGAFGSTPQFVFAEIAERTSIHLSKIKKEKPGLGIELDKQYSEILDKMNGAPVQLSLEEQIEFALGYQHQHQARFNKRSVANA